VGSFVKIMATSHPIEQQEHSPPGGDHDLATHICFGSWLGAGVMMLPGVTIGRGCVIGAGAVIVRSSEPNGL